MTDPNWPALEDCENLLDDREEEFWRQVHPNHVSAEGHVSPEGFTGTPDDRYRVSGASSTSTTAEEAYAYHTEVLELSSSGSWAVAVGDVLEEGCRCVDDSACEEVDTPGHVYVDMRGLDRGGQRAARAAFAAAATLKGRRHP